MKVLCRTLFDCTVTGTTGHFRVSEVPYQDRAGHTINDIQQWNRSRNQQRNYETLLQIIGLRTQPENISAPTVNNSTWEFTFETDSEFVFAKDGEADPFANLLIDCNGVPMMTGLDETPTPGPVLVPLKNIWFEQVNM
jgi:hypothetical protein